MSKNVRELWSKFSIVGQPSKSTVNGQLLSQQLWRLGQWLWWLGQQLSGLTRLQLNKLTRSNSVSWLGFLGSELPATIDGSSELRSGWFRWRWIRLVESFNLIYYMTKFNSDTTLLTSKHNKKKNYENKFIAPQLSFLQKLTQHSREALLLIFSLIFLCYNSQWEGVFILTLNQYKPHKFT